MPTPKNEVPMTNILQSAAWIGSGEIGGAPILSRRFTAASASAASLTITGLGYFEAFINGRPVSTDRFVPVVTDYEPRSFTKITYPCRDHFTHRIYVYTYDIAPLLHDGENLLEIRLGCGWYWQPERVAEGEMSYSGHLKAIYALNLGGEVLVSDGSETWRESEVLENNLFLGEVIDARFHDTCEKPVQRFPSPASELSEAIGVPDRHIRTILPREIGSVGGKRIFDCGENISGVVRVTTSASAGSRITLTFAENLGADGALDHGTTGHNYRCTSGRPQIQSDSFIADGTARTFEPRFVWHCFRYFDVEGEIDAAEVLVIHSDVPVTAEFDSASEGMNYLFDTYLRTQLDNMHGSIPSDCPHRERLGYTGDGQACAEAAMLLLDSREFYRKWIRDILDCQDTERGHVQHTAPFQGGGGGPGGWGSAIVIVPYRYWKAFGDADMLRICWEPMKKWLGYLDASLEDSLIVREEAGGWCLGDWASMDKMVLPEPFVNTVYFVKCLQMMAEIAPVIGHAAEIPALLEKAEQLKAAIRAAYRDVDGHYLGGVQGADAFAAWISLDEAETARLAAERYAELACFDTGFLCADILPEVLLSHGYADAAFTLFDGDKPGTFLALKRRGFTTIPEYMHGRNSHCHPMFGGCTRHLLQGFLGITQEAGSAGYAKILIAPKLPEGLAYARGSVIAAAGKIAVSWHREPDGIHFEIELPKAAQFVCGSDSRTLAAGINKFVI
ncbi:MAG: hypothetical protein E7632_08000 [Ruminococcaceae bacterium]|nr:hypothetical protein [Oscillospiraceae bacterium]